MFREWFRSNYDYLWLQYLENAPPQYPLVQWVEHNHPEVWAEYKLGRTLVLMLKALIKGEEVKVNGAKYIRDKFGTIDHLDFYFINFDTMTIQELIDLSLQMTAQEIEELTWLS